MKPVLSRAQMRAFDAHAIGACAVPGVVLMENAGRGAADVIERECLRGAAAGARVAIVVGTGNNGGDGFVVARHLIARGATVDVHLVGDRARIGGDAKANLDALLGIGGSVRDVGDLADVTRSLPLALHGADVVVDALLGTGLDREVGGLQAGAIAAMNGARAPVVALDLPSGIDADTGATFGASVVAARTVTFAHYKLGLLTPGGTRACGVVHLVDIGVPAAVAERAADLVEARDVASWLVPRARDAHKNTAGHVAIVAGSPGKTGAARMVARAALRAGAGLVTIATWAESAAAVEAGATEAMTARIDRANAASIDAVLAGKRAAVIGPGLGVDEGARAVVERTLAFAGPLVLDADALTLFAGAPERLVAARAILTPHPGECARLLGVTSADVERDRFGAARALAARSGAVVLLKGVYTLVASPDGRVAINPTGNAALATGGSGDVLAGIVGAFACALAPFDAACAGAFVHGLAADAWSAANGDRGLLASEIADLVPRTLRDIADGSAATRLVSFDTRR